VFVAWIAAEIYRSDFRRICAIRFGQRGLQEDAFAKLVAEFLDEFSLFF